MLPKRAVLVTAFCLACAAAALSPSARAAFTSGSDGSDGALNCAWLAKDVGFDCATRCLPADPENPNAGPCTFVVDLSKANSTPGTTYQTPGGDIDGDGFGDGVYDAKQWAVVYKFTTINIPANVIVTFKNHPSGAPVVWLAQGNVDIFGMINLAGENAHLVQVWPSFSEPGPGGFPGGAPADRYSRVGSLGFGPGSATQPGPGGGSLTDGCYSGYDNGDYAGNHGVAPCEDGRSYGNSEIFPLIGGSGGGVSFNTNAGATRLVVGGAGGGAILVATDADIHLAPGSNISAFSGVGYCDNDGAQWAGSGTSGAIRLVAGVRIWGNPYLYVGGFNWPGPDYCRDYPAYGRLRLEAPTIDIAYQGPSQEGVTTSFLPGKVFPEGDAPVLEVVSVSNNGVPVPAPPDPPAGPDTVEIPLDTDQVSQIVIRAWNIPASTSAGPTKVTVRVVPVLGNEIIATSTALALQPDGSLRATANVTFPPGRSEIQLRANWPTP